MQREDVKVGMSVLLNCSEMQVVGFEQDYVCLEYKGIPFIVKPGMIEEYKG